MIYSVFISHSNHQDDWQRVQNLEQWLKEIGIQPILARRVLSPEPASNKIQKMMNSTDAIIVFWTSHSSKSGFVNQEIGYASGKKPIIVLKDPNVSMTGFVYGYDTIDMSPEKGKEEVEKLRSLLQQKKSGKELENMIVNVILGFALGVGLVLLLAKSK